MYKSLQCPTLVGTVGGQNQQIWNIWFSHLVLFYMVNYRIKWLINNISTYKVHLDQLWLKYSQGLSIWAIFASDRPKGKTRQPLGVSNLVLFRTSWIQTDLGWRTGNRRRKHVTTNQANMEQPLSIKYHKYTRHCSMNCAEWSGIMSLLVCKLKWAYLWIKWKTAWQNN